MDQDADTRWQRVCDLFAGALAHEPQDRDAWLTFECHDDAALVAEVTQLLRAHEHRENAQHGRPDDEPPPHDESEAALDEAARTGATVGGFRIGRRIGRGSGASVYLAERADGQGQPLALKLLREGSVAAPLRVRYAQTRDALVRIVHPGIARLHDAGLTEQGAPYLMAEFVDGEPITRWADARRLGLRQRIELLLQACDAVQHAHRHLALHRDIKPANVLVTSDGTVKLVDLGVATLIDPDRRGAAGVSSMRYVAPEQALGESVTTATDVHALGLLAYELACGRLPHAEAGDDTFSWTRAVVEQPIQPMVQALSREQSALDALLDADTLASARGSTPAALRRMLDGELERIVQRALAKAPEARHASVSDFATELRAWLERTNTSALAAFVHRWWWPIALAVAVAAGVGAWWLRR